MRWFYQFNAPSLFLPLKKLITHPNFIAVKRLVENFHSKSKAKIIPAIFTGKNISFQKSSLPVPADINTNLTHQGASEKRRFKIKKCDIRYLEFINIYFIRIFISYKCHSILIMNCILSVNR